MATTTSDMSVGLSSSDPPRVLLAVPLAARDLEGHALLVRHLTKCHGVAAKLVDVQCFEEVLFRWTPDAIVLDGLRLAGRARIAALAKDLGIRIIVMPVSGLADDPEDHARMAGKSHNVTDTIDAFLAWGPGMRQVLLERTTLTPSRVPVTGHPRFDLYSPEYRALLEPRGDFVSRLGFTDPDAPIVAWALGTPHIGMDLRGFVPYRMADAGLEPDVIISQLEDERTQFQEQSRVVLDLARRHPEWNFVIKVHPAEDPAAYQYLTAGRSNLRIAHAIPVRDVLAHCTVLLQRGSTTASDAWLLAKPVLELNMGSFHGHWAPTPYLDGNHSVATLDDADAAIGDYVRGMPVSAERKSAQGVFLSAWYGKTDGRAFERCANRVAEEASLGRWGGGERQRMRSGVLAEGERRKQLIDSRLANRLKDALGIDRRRSLRSLRTWLQWDRGRANGHPDHLPEETVAEVLARYETLDSAGGRDG